MARPSPGSNAAGVRWHPPGQPARIGRHTVPDGMVYVGHHSVGRRDHRTADPPPCLVDPSLKVANDPGPIQNDLGYWPSYAAITPAARAAYLEWLAGGRKDPEAALGHVFLFFYGLERRLLIDRPPAAERDALLAEMERLRSIYRHSGSLAGYTAALMREVRLRDTLSRPGWSDGWLPDPAGDCEAIAPLLRIAIGAAVVDGKRLPFELAMASLLAMPAHLGGISKGKVVRRFRPVFLDLMRCRFTEKFPKGFKLRDKAGSKLALNYHAATMNFGVPAVMLDRRVPDPWDLTWTKLTDLCAQAASDLAAYARHAGTDDATAKMPEALAALPTELQATRHGALQALGAWLDGMPAVSAVAAEDLWTRCLGQGAPAAKDVRIVGAILAGLGYGVEPDPACGKAHLGAIVGVFKTPPGATHLREPSIRLATARLGALLLRGLLEADAVATAAATEAILRGLDATEALRIEAFLLSLAEAPVSAADLRKAARAVEPGQRPAAAVLLRDVAGALGAATSRQVAMLEALHDALGQDRGAVYTALHRAAPPLRTGTTAARPAAAVPDRSQAQAPAASALDLDAIRRIRAETNEVSAMLTDVWRDDVVDAGSSPVTAQVSAKDAGAQSTVDGLDAAHAALLSALLMRPCWNRADYEALTRRLGLMPDAAAETLNDWSLDRFDEALVEDDGGTLTVAQLPFTEEAA